MPEKTKAKNSLEAKVDYLNYVVHVQDLYVLVTENNGDWFAQGLQIDYAAQGSSWLAVRKAFEDGLIATIDLHLRKYGNLDHFLSHTAPKEAWDRYREAKVQRRFGSTSLHLGVPKLERVEIKYAQLEKAA